MAREVVNRVQKLRKKGGLQATDPVEVFIHIPAAQGTRENQAMLSNPDKNP